MNINTSRFGPVTIDEGDVLTFVDGLIGMEQCRRWVLLADVQNDSLGWMQSLERPDVALAVVCPQRFVPEYRVHVSRRDVLPLGLSASEEAQVLVIVSQSSGALALNLKAPLVIHLEKRLGRQIVARDDHAVQHRLQTSSSLRLTA